jgi:Amt family ammonium transporter
VNAFVVTNTAAAAAAFTWMILSWYFSGKPSVVGACAGAVAGLVAITPASGFVQPMEALAIGVGAGVFCYAAVRIRAMTSLDDSLDVVGVHGIGGIWGGIATGLFATAVVSGVDTFEGVLEGNAGQMGDQLAALGIVAAYSFVMTSIILKVLDVTLGLRVKDDEEVAGLDVSQHGERAYVIEETGALPTMQTAQTTSQAQAAKPSPAPAPSGGGGAR